MQTWKNKVIYQIFPRSYYDANNDGDGDLKGLTAKLDYLETLGIDAIWLCPIYDTEFADAGYDVLNYQAVWKQFGTLDDFRIFAKACQVRKIGIIMDIVLNHTSSKHAWFQKALASKNNIEHNYYIWKTKPTAAQSIFGGSAWEYSPQTGQYYFHLFAKEQVDLNWSNPGTLQAMADVIDFWYRLGVRGFRLDAIQHIWKDFKKDTVITSFGSKMVPTLQTFNKLAFANKPDVFIMGEASGINPQLVKKYGMGSQKIAANFFNFAWWSIGWGHGPQRTGRNDYDPHWTVQQFLGEMKKYQEDSAIPPQLTSVFLTSHDTSRALSRWGNEKAYWAQSAKALALLQFSMKGIPIVYYGEEIGMLNPGFAQKSDLRDVDALNAYATFVNQEKRYTARQMMQMINKNGRDNARTPFQWNMHRNAGFNQGHQPWIKIGDTYQKINLAAQINDPQSIMTFYKRLIATRKDAELAPILVDGKSAMRLIDQTILRIERSNGSAKIIVVINLANETKKFQHLGAKILFNSYHEVGKNNLLRPYEAIMYYIKGAK